MQTFFTPAHPGKLILGLGPAFSLPTATAYPHRRARYDWLLLSQWADPADSPRNIAWTREFFEAMRPSFTGGVYVNNLGAEGPARVRQAYGPNHERLVAVKTRYDPANVFRHNQNIVIG